jgi:Acyl-CoA carboxylase epsilon subunit
MTDEPLITVLRGRPDDDELAALTAVVAALLARAGATAARAEPVRPPTRGRFPAYDIPLSWQVAAAA